MLDPYVEGECDEETAQSLTAHLTGCRACAGAHAELLREQEIYASYLVEVEPPPALWARLRAQLEEEKALNGSQPQFRLQRWLAIAFESLQIAPRLATALVLIIIGLALGIMVWRRTVDIPTQPAPKVVGVQPSSEVNREVVHRSPNNTDGRNSTNHNDGNIKPFSVKSGERGSGVRVSVAARAGRRAGSPAVPMVDLVARRAEQQYLSAIEILSRDIKSRRTIISPALRSQLETALADVDRNIAATRRVAREQPRDPVAVQYLALAYEKKIELLREVSMW
jgi:AhpD family alkylhydroperoxidase